MAIVPEDEYFFHDQFRFLGYPPKFHEVIDQLFDLVFYHFSVG